MPDSTVPVKLEAVRRFALSLPEVTEQPHHDFGSFRVRGKIFCTVPPEGDRLHLFLADPERDLALALHPDFVEKLPWGGRIVGVRVHLRAARPAAVRAMLQQAWTAKAPKALAAPPAAPGPAAVTIADARPGEARAIRALMARVIGRDVTQDADLLADTRGNVDANVALWLAQPERCVHLVARVGRRLHGVVLVKDHWNLCSLFVDSVHQRQGLGRRLLEAAAERCRGRSPERALLLNAAPAAVAFYRRLGFVERVPARPLPAGFVAMRRPL